MLAAECPGLGVIWSLLSSTQRPAFTSCSPPQPCPDTRRAEMPPRRSRTHGHKALGAAAVTYQAQRWADLTGLLSGSANCACELATCLWKSPRLLGHGHPTRVGTASGSAPGAVAKPRSCDKDGMACKSAKYFLSGCFPKADPRPR